MIIGAAIIALREGIEAALVIAIVMSYLKKTDRMQFKEHVGLGVTLAIIFSVVVGVILGWVWGVFEGEALSVFEGTMVLVAAFFLTTMILWMWQVGPEISQTIEQSVEIKSESRGAIGVFILSFSLILREGIELVFFTFALSIKDAEQTLIGVSIGLAVSTTIGVVIYHGSGRLSLRSFFKWSSLFLVLFAAGMIAYGIHELQEANLLLIGPLETWNINPPVMPDGSYPILHEKGTIGEILKSLFGYNGIPSALEVMFYIFYLIGVTAYY